MNPIVRIDDLDMVNVIQLQEITDRFTILLIRIFK